MIVLFFLFFFLCFQSHFNEISYKRSIPRAFKETHFVATLLRFIFTLKHIFYISHHMFSHIYMLIRIHFFLPGGVSPRHSILDIKSK